MNEVKIIVQTKSWNANINATNSNLFKSHGSFSSCFYYLAFAMQNLRRSLYRVESLNITQRVAFVYCSLLAFGYVFIFDLSGLSHAYRMTESKAVWLAFGTGEFQHPSFNASYIYFPFLGGSGGSVVCFISSTRPPRSHSRPPLRLFFPFTSFSFAYFFLNLLQLLFLHLSLLLLFLLPFFNRIGNAWMSLPAQILNTNTIEIFKRLHCHLLAPPNLTYYAPH